VTADILIVGAGFTGALAAAALADGRRRIVVLDSGPAGHPRFGGELIHAAGVDILAELGLWPILADGNGERIDGFRVTGGANDPPVLLPYRDVPAGRPGGLAMDHQQIVARVRDHVARQDSVDVRAGQRAVDVLWKGGRIAGVRTASGADIHATLTLVADGRHSRLRKAMGIRARQHAISLSAMLLAKDGSLPTRGYGHICLGAWGPTLAYGLRDRDVRFCIDVPIQLEKGRERIPHLLRARNAPCLPESLRGDMLRALEAGPIELCGNHIVSTDRCTLPGAALLGDAAGCSHPLTASGMTNSLSDIRILVEELRVGDSLDEALARYEVRRYRFVRVREILADALYEAFRGGRAGSQAIRTGILRYWRTSAGGRETTIALLSGDDARLATFVGEYLRVMLESIQSVVQGQAGDSSLQGRAQSLAGLFMESLELLNRVGAGVYTGTLR
jgi:2-polyprenyl-6-methoxyphenol hydroxylase-like FAD-dependent oxidoreductase